MRSQWGVTPRVSIEAACRRRGREDVVDRCLQLLAGGDADDADLLMALAGPGAPQLVDTTRTDGYWLRVWGARGLLWAWDTSCDAPLTAALRGALSDPHWRVREMALKVATRHLVADLLDDVLPLRDDPVPRVAGAARRAVVRLTPR
jgi:hypothetical protein